MKNSIAIILFVVIYFTACTKKSGTNRRLVEDHFKYMNAHNLAAIKNQYADSASIYTHLMPGDKIGPLGAEEVYHFLFFQSPNEQYRVLNVIDNDTTTVVQYDVRGYLSTNISRSGYGYINCSIFNIKNGKIIKEADYTGRLSTEVNH